MGILLVIQVIREKKNSFWCSLNRSFYIGKTINVACVGDYLAGKVLQGGFQCLCDYVISMLDMLILGVAKPGRYKGW